MKSWIYLLALLIIAFCSTKAVAQGGSGDAIKTEPKSPPKSPAAPRREPRGTPTKAPVIRTTPTPRTVATADLTINAYQGNASVLINGQLRGSTNSDGRLNIRLLKPGQYTVIVRKPNYIEQQRSIMLYPGQSLILELGLRGLPGRLSVMPGVNDATIEISGVGSYQGQVSNLELQSGKYEVTVSKSGYHTATQTVVVNMNAPTSISVPLAEYTIEEMVGEATAEFQNKQYNRAIASSETILSKQPDHPRANLLAGLSYFYNEQYATSTAYLRKALADGEVFSLPIKHHHKAWTSFLPSDALCTGTLTIGGGMLTFKSIDGKPDEGFTVPASKIVEVKAEPNKAGRIHVEILVLNSGKKKEEKKGQNFQTSHTITRDPTPGDSSTMEFVYCENCQAEMQTIYDLLVQLKNSTAAPATGVTNTKGPGSDLPVLKRRKP